MTREEAIEVYNGLINTKIKEAFEFFAPELHESEDERIRKEIISFLRSPFIKENLTDEKVAPWLVWLEKQKEQKSLNISAASEWLRKNVCHYVNSEYNEFHKCVEYDGSIDKEKLIKDFEEAMQKEQKPGVTHGETYRVDTLGTQQVIAGKMPQKPELVQHPPITFTYNSNASRDERLKAALLALLNSDLLKIKEGGYFTKQDLIEWVERIPTDKPAEWSPSWKPSEEQMDALAYASQVLGSDLSPRAAKASEELEGILEHFKKL